MASTKSSLDQFDAEAALRNAQALVDGANETYSGVSNGGVHMFAKKRKRASTSMRAHLEKNARIKELASHAPYDVSLKDIEIRPYQLAVVNDTLDRRDATPPQSSIVVLPCGAGKTLVGMYMCVAACQRSLEDARNAVESKAFLIVTVGPEGADYWHRSFCKHTTFDPNSILLLKSGDQDQIVVPGQHRIVIASIGLLTKSSAGRNPTLTKVQKIKFHMAILDECHMIPAQNARQIITDGTRWSIERWVGLTASPLRADNQYSWMLDKIGVELRPVGWRELEARGCLTPMVMTMIRCPLPDSWRDSYEQATPLERRRYDLFNPRKLAMLEVLLRHWKRENERSDGFKRVTIIFCDTIELLRFVYEKFDIPYIDGSTSPEDTLQWLEAMRSGKLDIILMSRSGDQGIDIPRVSRVVILDALDGSQRQEVQRAGRMLRPFEGKAEAQLFDIHTDSSRCTEYATQRIQFLVEQGYEVRYMKPCDLHINGQVVSSDSVHFADDGTAYRNMFSCPDVQQKIFESLETYEERKKEEAEALKRSTVELKKRLDARDRGSKKARHVSSNGHINKQTKAMFAKRFKQEREIVKGQIEEAVQTRDATLTFQLSQKPLAQPSISEICAAPSKK